jgi:isoquinoline 1-oxidoreductase subunit alpha
LKDSGIEETVSRENLMLQLLVNGTPTDVDVPPDTPLLWVLRDTIGLTGTKYGCGLGLCGACTVHVNGAAVRSCQLPVRTLTGKSILTIEGLSSQGDHPVQRAWLRHQVPQCGYCQAGQIMSAVALLAAKPRPTDQDIDDAMSGNLCRCGTYQRIRAAIHAASGVSGDGS